MPTNLYSPNDNSHLENSHVMPAMTRMVYLAKLIHDGAWDMIAIDLNKRPVEGVKGTSTKEEIMQVFGNIYLTADVVQQLNINPQQIR